MAERRGFAAMDENQRREIASMGGRAAHERGRAHEWDQQEAAKAGRKGGEKVSRNRQHMAEIGRRGGLAAHHRGGAVGVARRQTPRQEEGGNGAENQHRGEMGNEQTQNAAGQGPQERGFGGMAEGQQTAGTVPQNGAGHTSDEEGTLQTGDRLEPAAGNGARCVTVQQQTDAGLPTNTSE